MTYLASRLFGTPLLVHRAKLDVILAVMGERLGLAVPAVDLALPPPKPATATPAGISGIPVHGTLVKRSLGLSAEDRSVGTAGVRMVTSRWSQETSIKKTTQSTTISN